MHEPAPASRSDLVVGSWRLPAPLRGLPPTVWVFAIAAVVDAALRLLLSDGGFQQAWENPQFLFSLAVFSLRSAVLVFLPGAVLLGRWAVPARSAAFAGAVLIAVSELIELAMAVVPVGRLLPAALVEPDQFGRISGLESVRVLAAVLALVGLLGLFAAVNRSRSGDPSSAARRWAAVIAVIAIAATLAAVLNLILAVTATGADGTLPGFVPALSDALVAGSRAAGGLVLGLIAAVAILGRSGARGDGRGWTAMAMGAGLSTAIAGFYVLVSVVGLLGYVPAADSSWLLLFTLTSTLSLVGVIALVVGVAIGPEASGAPGSSDRPATMSPRDPGSE